ncbi:hypothetical protein OH77DRAFT_800067 [Trametes cingulata]|nr:hypothetical protein OH77DRAFT_800067 [Trametes cingulata]
MIISGLPIIQPCVCEDSNDLECLEVSHNCSIGKPVEGRTLQSQQCLPSQQRLSVQHGRYSCPCQCDWYSACMEQLCNARIEHLARCPTRALDGCSTHVSVPRYTTHRTCLHATSGVIALRYALQERGRVAIGPHGQSECCARSRKRRGTHGARDWHPDVSRRLLPSLTRPPVPRSP